MLTTTYKLIVKLIALHLRTLLPKPVSDQQTSFIPGRQILDNISITWLVFDKLQLDKTAALFLKLDFEKAFDRVDFNYIWASLRALGLGGKFLTLMQGLILGGSVKTHSNGHFSEPIPLQRGVHQGCPLAPMLFALNTQPLLAFLQAERSQGRMLGIHIDGPIFVCKRMFADDLGVLLPASPQNFQELKDVLNLYEWASGAKLNIQKSIVIPIELDPIPQWVIDKGCQLIAPGTITKFLGAPLGVSFKPHQIQDFCLDRVCKRITGWQTKHISFVGKLIPNRQVMQAIPTYHLMYIHFNKAMSLQLQ